MPLLIFIILAVIAAVIASMVMNKKAESKDDAGAEPNEAPALAAQPQTDDGEIIAVIAAALAAYQAQAGGGKLVVRSVRRVGVTVPTYAALSRQAQLYGR